MISDKGQKFSATVPARRKRQINSLVEKEGSFGLILTVGFRLPRNPLYSSYTVAQCPSFRLVCGSVSLSLGWQICPEIDVMSQDFHKLLVVGFITIHGCINFTNEGVSALADNVSRSPSISASQLSSLTTIPPSLPSRFAILFIPLTSLSTT